MIRDLLQITNNNYYYYLFSEVKIISELKVLELNKLLFQLNIRNICHRMPFHSVLGLLGFQLLIANQTKKSDKTFQK